MIRTASVVAAFTLSVLLGSYLSLAQQNPAQPNAPRQPMSFFVTSVGLGRGANLGALAGADAHCQALATAVGSGDKTWHAYLSTQASGQSHVAYTQAVNARDRIGMGPWYNAKGVMIAKSVADLHGDTLESARIGNGITKANALTEKGDQVKGFGDTPNMHDMLTGSKPDGRAYMDAADHTCSSWTNDAIGVGSAQLGHADRNGGGNISWNSVHSSRGCSQADLVATGGAGLFYCFAID